MCLTKQSCLEATQYSGRRTDRTTFGKLKDSLESSTPIKQAAKVRPPNDIRSFLITYLVLSDQRH